MHRGNRCSLMHGNSVYFLCISPSAPDRSAHHFVSDNIPVLLWYSYRYRKNFPDRFRSRIRYLFWNCRWNPSGQPWSILTHQNRGNIFQHTLYRSVDRLYLPICQKCFWFRYLYWYFHRCFAWYFEWILLSVPSEVYSGHPVHLRNVRSESVQTNLYTDIRTVSGWAPARICNNRFLHTLCYLPAPGY